MSTNSSYNQIAFALEILKLLAEKSYYRQDLTDLLNVFLEKHGKTTEDVSQKLTRTIRKLKDCGFEIKSAPNRPYELLETNFPVILSIEQKQALAIAAQLLSDLGFSAQATQILKITDVSNSAYISELKSDFSPPTDYSNEKLSNLIYELQKRCQERCFYVIRYCNSQGITDNWDLGNSELRYHDGTLYLFAFVSTQRFDHHQVEQNRLFRIDRIKYVFPSSKTPWYMFNIPTLKIRYRMTGYLKNYQPRRVHEVVIERNQENRFVDIETEEDCLFWFRQRLLKYGANAHILEPVWLAKQIADELQQSYANYQHIISQAVA